MITAKEILQAIETNDPDLRRKAKLDGFVEFETSGDKILISIYDIQAIRQRHSGTDLIVGGAITGVGTSYEDVVKIHDFITGLHKTDDEIIKEQNLPYYTTEEIDTLLVGYVQWCDLVSKEPQEKNDCCVVPHPSEMKPLKNVRYATAKDLEFLVKHGTIIDMDSGEVLNEDD